MNQINNKLEKKKWILIIKKNLKIGGRENLGANNKNNNSKSNPRDCKEEDVSDIDFQYFSRVNVKESEKINLPGG